MMRSIYIYVGSVAFATLLLLLTLPWGAFATLGPRDIVGICAFVLLGVFSEAFATDFTIGPNKTIKSSLAFVPLFACAYVFPPAVGISAGLLITSLTQIVRKVALWKAIFNVSEVALSLGLSTGIAQLIGGEYWKTPEVSLLAFGSFAAVAFGTNLVLIASASAIIQRAPLLATLRKAMGPAGGNFFYDLLASPIALIAAILYRDIYIAGLLFITLPLVLVRYSYLAKLQLQQANRDLLHVLIKAIETRDPYTSGHSVRVSVLARLISEDLGLSRRRTEQIETAALLHDVGKIDAIYASLIRKNSALSDGERMTIRTHATKGAELLENLSSVGKEVIEGVRHHHEWYDGRGYPSGLVGKQIPLPARIIMLSDAIDAMLSDRPYRRALRADAVKEELRRCAGAQFDPDIVEVILDRGTIERAEALVRRDGSASAEILRTQLA